MFKIIKLDNNVEVEVDIDETQAREISSDSRVKASIDQMQGLLMKVVKPLSNTYIELNKDMAIQEAKVTLGVKIGVEGNFILAKSSVGAHIQVELTLRGSNA